MKDYPVVSAPCKECEALMFHEPWCPEYSHEYYQDAILRLPDDPLIVHLRKVLNEE